MTGIPSSPLFSIPSDTTHSALVVSAPWAHDDSLFPRFDGDHPPRGAGANFSCPILIVVSKIIMLTNVGSNLASLQLPK